MTKLKDRVFLLEQLRPKWHLLFLLVTFQWGRAYSIIKWRLVKRFLRRCNIPELWQIFGFWQGVMEQKGIKLEDFFPDLSGDDCVTLMVMKRKGIKLQGLWKGIKITEEDIKEVREELLKKLEARWDEDTKSFSI